MALLQSTLAHAQTASASPEGADQAPLRLRPSPQLQERLSDEVRQNLPTFYSGQHTSGRPDLETVIEGDAMLRRGDLLIRADRLEYYQPDDQAKATGHVRINRAGNVYEGPALELKVDAFQGHFSQPTFELLKNGAVGEAERIDFIDERRSVVHKASYTTCRRKPGPSWLPDWVLMADKITLDEENNVGQAEGAQLRFKDVPILPIPQFMTFPLTDERKSGALPPTIALDNVNGLDLTVPYYLNLAPNRDLTLYPSLMSRRGVDLGTEFRYLERPYRGQLRADYMPSDSLRQRSRWGASAQHQGLIDTGLASIGPVAASLNMSRVSDDNYWRDFPRATPTLTQRLLASDGRLNWAQGDFSASVRALKWQTLQDVSSPIIPPYDRLPQLAARFGRSNLVGYGVDFVTEADYTQFEADRTLTGQPNARRVFSRSEFSVPWRTPGVFFVPKVQLHATSYQFDAPLANGASSASRVLPTYSLDGGLVLERDTTLFGRHIRQTLEPRAFYVYTPYRDQSLLPNYDSGANDFSFSTIYTENAFVGNDRIADNNLLTLGVTSRFINPETGGEAARFGLAQRLRFKSQQVTLPGVVPIDDRLSDILAGASLSYNPRWTFDSTVQYNPKTNRSVRSTVGARYSPSNYRVVSAAYRFQRDLSELVDVGWQWPLNDLWGDRGRDLGPGRGLGVGESGGRWYSVGRMNYSMRDRKLVDAIVGFEYDAGCWLGRVVLERLQSGLTTANQRILFQLEFSGFSRLGSNPLKTLKENIPRYQYLREQISTPSRYNQYE